VTGTFQARTDELAHKVGHGDLKGRVEVDQIYARFQHERADLRHPRGGGPFYLRKAMMEHGQQHLVTIGRSILETGGVHAMADAMDEVVGLLPQYTPVEFGYLRDSGHAQVFDNGALAYDLPPIVPRLSEEQLKHRGHKHFGTTVRKGLRRRRRAGGGFL
jgi:hypothetical protein